MSELFDDLLTLRAYDINIDKDFIYSTFKKGLYFGNDYKTTINEETFFNNYQKILDYMLGSGAQVNILALKEDPRIVVSYCIFKENRVIWTYTKADWRRMGLTGWVLPKGFDTVVNLSRVGKAILKNHPEIIYNPFY